MLCLRACAILDLGVVGGDIRDSQGFLGHVRRGRQRSCIINTVGILTAFVLGEVDVTAWNRERSVPLAFGRTWAATDFISMLTERLVGYAVIVILLLLLL